MKAAVPRFLRVALLLSGLMASGGPSLRAEDAHAPVGMRLLMNGRAMNVQLVKGTEEMTLPLSALCAGLSAHLSLNVKQPGAITLMRGAYWVQLQLGNKRILYRATSGQNSVAKTNTLSLLPEPITRHNGELYGPVSLATYLGASVTVDKSAGTIRIVTSEDGAAQWKHDLGLPKDLVFASKTFAISRLKVTLAGPMLNTGVEAVVNVVLNAPGYVQIYQVEGDEVQPLLGQSDGKIVYFPLMRGIKPLPAHVEDRLRIPLRITPGTLYLIALATTQATSIDLREALLQGNITGEWGIKAIRLEEVGS